MNGDRYMKGVTEASTVSLDSGLTHGHSNMVPIPLGLVDNVPSMDPSKPSLDCV